MLVDIALVLANEVLRWDDWVMLHKIEGVPKIVQKPYWCGYTCLSMVLNYWGHEVSPDDLYDHIQGSTPDEERYTPKAAIGIGNLAMAAQELTPMRAELWSEERYLTLRRKCPGTGPHDILRPYLAKDIPAIVRIPYHYNVATGYDTDKDQYFFNETMGREVIKSTNWFEHQWSDKDPSMSYDTRHLILALRPQK